MCPQQFGGAWTEEKLNALEDYLRAYLKIFTSNVKASKLTRHYVDAFAGSGLREVKCTAPTSLSLKFSDTDAESAGEVAGYADGSARKVLSLESAFHHYWMIEKDPSHADSLRAMIKTDFPERAATCEVVPGDANEFLARWCDGLQWNDRAVVFLDPYGMAVNWETIIRLGKTEKVDLWMLFPVSSVIRMLPNAGPPNEAWSRRLNSFFGTEDWRTTFYLDDSPQAGLFSDPAPLTRNVDAEAVANFVLGRLKEHFVDVAPKPLALYNSRRSPLFHLVFAASNPRGAKAALNIANYIIGRR
jgi:three-Cys-motif partner protein